MRRPFGAAEGPELAEIDGDEDFEVLIRSTAWWLRRIALIGRHVRQMDWLAERASRLIETERASVQQGRQGELRGLRIDQLRRLEDVIGRAQAGEASRRELEGLAGELEALAAQSYGRLERHRSEPYRRDAHG